MFQKYVNLTIVLRVGGGRALGFIYPYTLNPWTPLETPQPLLIINFHDYVSFFYVFISHRSTYAWTMTTRMMTVSGMEIYFWIIFSILLNCYSIIK